jgi:hypothetical protein
MLIDRSRHGLIDLKVTGCASHPALRRNKAGGRSIIARDLSILLTAPPAGSWPAWATSQSTL